MPWLKFSVEPFGFGRSDGPPPSRLIGWLRVSWWSGTYEELLSKMQTALKQAREELKQ